MRNKLAPSYSSFDGFRVISSGSLLDNVLAVKRALDRNALGPVLTFDDQTGRTVDTDPRGSESEIVARFEATPTANGNGSAGEEEIEAGSSPLAEPRGRGRPKLGVVAREVTLLPRHWDWLSTQAGGASVALRKLVEEARKTRVEKDRLRAAQDRAYHFMVAIAGNLPGYEEATRALFANDQAKFCALVEAWPIDVRDHAVRLAFDHVASTASGAKVEVRLNEPDPTG